MTVDRVHRMLRHAPLEPEYTFGNGESLLVRAPVPDYLAGRQAAEFNVEGEITAIEVTRGGHSMIPGPGADAPARRPGQLRGRLQRPGAAAQLPRREVAVMHIIVAGGGTVGQRVAQAVHAAGNTVAIVEEDPARAAELTARGLQVVTGNACAPGRLEAAGALHADVLVACTGRDEDNLIISVLARRRFEVPRIVATVRDDANRWLFDASWGVDAAISAASALVTLIEEATGSAQTVRLADLAGSGLALVETNITVAVGGPRQDRGRPAPASR